jgi:hypothetical protein
VFVRRKKVKGYIYYQLVRNYREDGKHRQQVLCHLGIYRTLEAAISTERAIAERHESNAAFYERQAQSTKNILKNFYSRKLVNEYQDYREEARRKRKRAATHRTRLNKFLECKRKYF